MTSTAHRLNTKSNKPLMPQNIYLTIYYPLIYKFTQKSNIEKNYRMTESYQSTAHEYQVKLRFCNHTIKFITSITQLKNNFTSSESHK
jgi:hypothetical protein